MQHISRYIRLHFLLLLLHWQRSGVLLNCFDCRLRSGPVRQSSLLQVLNRHLTLVRALALDHGPSRGEARLSAIVRCRVVLSLVVRSRTRRCLLVRSLHFIRAFNARAVVDCVQLMGLVGLVELTVLKVVRVGVFWRCYLLSRVGVVGLVWKNGRHLLNSRSILLRARLHLLNSILNLLLLNGELPIRQLLNTSSLGFFLLLNNCLLREVLLLRFIFRRLFFVFYQHLGHHFARSLFVFVLTDRLLHWLHCEAWEVQISSRQVDIRLRLFVHEPVHQVLKLHIFNRAVPPRLLAHALVSFNGLRLALVLLDRHVQFVEWVIELRVEQFVLVIVEERVLLFLLCDQFLDLVLLIY